MVGPPGPFPEAGAPAKSLADDRLRCTTTCLPAMLETVVSLVVTKLVEISQDKVM